MEWHWHDRVGALQQIRASRAHQRRERRRERAPSFVLEGMDDFPE
jgi:hypothetical protein